MQGSFNKLTPATRQEVPQSSGDRPEGFIEPLLTTEVERFLQVCKTIESTTVAEIVLQVARTVYKSVSLVRHVMKCPDRSGSVPRG